MSLDGHNKETIEAECSELCRDLLGHLRPHEASRREFYYLRDLLVSAFRTWRDERVQCGQLFVIMEPWLQQAREFFAGHGEPPFVGACFLREALDLVIRYKLGLEVDTDSEDSGQSHFFFMEGNL